jgi:hypothetical protein
MDRSHVMMDALESRTLLNGAVFGGGHEGPGDLGGLPRLPANPSPTVQADYNKAVADLGKVNADKTAIAADLLALKTAVEDAKTTLATQLAPLLAQLKTDVTAEQATLKADFLAIQAVYVADQPAIFTDLKNSSMDIATGNTAKLALDKTQLATDQAKLKTDLADPLAKLKADDAAADALVDADQQAIHDLIYSLPAVQKAQDQLAADQALYTTDLKAFVADRTQLLKDIKAGV